MGFHFNVCCVEFAGACLCPVGAKLYGGWRLFGWLLKPKGGLITGLNLGVGAAKNIVNVELAHVSSGGYGLGIGPGYLACISGCLVNGYVPFTVGIADSAVVNVTVNYSRDIYHTPRLMIFGTAGGGFSRSRHTDVEDCTGCGSYYSSLSAPVLMVGGGIRVPLTKGFGIRADLKGWVYKIDNAVTGTNRLTGLTVGLYYRRLNHL